MASSSLSSHDFLVRFFAETFPPPSGVSAEKYNNHHGSPFTENFLHQLCRTQHLATVQDLFLFLLAEEAYTVRLAAAQAAARTTDFGTVSHEGTALSASLRPNMRGSYVARRSEEAKLSERKRAREGDAAVGSVFAPDAVLAALMKALSCHCLSLGDNGGVRLHPSCALLTSRLSVPCVGHRAGEKGEAGLRGLPKTIFYSSGCSEVDAALLTNRPCASALTRTESQGTTSGQCDLVRGGFCSHQLTEVCGEAGTGKTLLALQVGLTYIARKLAADLICRFFVNLDASHVSDRNPRYASHAAESGALEEEPRVTKESSHPLQLYWPEVESLLSWLNTGEETVASCSCGRDVSVVERLRRVRLHASPVCCFYLVSEDMPAARLSSLATGAVTSLRTLLTQYFAPLLPSDLYVTFQRALRAGLTLEAVLDGLKVRPFSSLEELLALIHVSEAGERDGPLVEAVVATRCLWQQQQRERQPCACASSGASACGGLLLVDSIAAAAMQSAEAIEARRAQTPRQPKQRSLLHALLEKTGTALRRLAAQYGLCVVITNQVRSVVASTEFSYGATAGDEGDGVRDPGDVLAMNPVIRLKNFQGFTAAATGGRRLGAVQGLSSDDGTRRPRGRWQNAEPVPALGFAWAVFPHTRVFLRKRETHHGWEEHPRTSASLREMLLTASPVAAPFAMAYTITTDGMRVPPPQPD